MVDSYHPGASHHMGQSEDCCFMVVPLPDLIQWKLPPCFQRAYLKMESQVPLFLVVLVGKERVRYMGHNCSSVSPAAVIRYDAMVSLLWISRCHQDGDEGSAARVEFSDTSAPGKSLSIMVGLDCTFFAKMPWVYRPPARAL